MLPPLRRRITKVKALVQGEHGLHGLDGGVDVDIEGLIDPLKPEVAVYPVPAEFGGRNLFAQTVGRLDSGIKLVLPGQLGESQIIDGPAGVHFEHHA